MQFSVILEVVSRAHNMLHPNILLSHSAWRNASVVSHRTDKGVGGGGGGGGKERCTRKKYLHPSFIKSQIELAYSCGLLVVPKWFKIMYPEIPLPCVKYIFHDDQRVLQTTVSRSIKW